MTPLMQNLLASSWSLKRKYGEVVLQGVVASFPQTLNRKVYNECTLVNITI